MSEDPKFVDLPENVESWTNLQCSKAKLVFVPVAVEKYNISAFLWTVWKTWFAGNLKYWGTFWEISVEGFSFFVPTPDGLIHHSKIMKGYASLPAIHIQGFAAFFLPNERHFKGNEKIMQI